MRVLFQVIGFEVVGILVLDHFVLAFDALGAGYALVVFALEVFLHAGFDKLGLHIRASMVLRVHQFLIRLRGVPLSDDVWVLILVFDFSLLLLN